jgi:hypothetical protein
VYLSIFHADVVDFLSVRKENADEKTRIKTLSLGLVVPDMPTGSPGMEYGSHKDKFTVFKFKKNGKTSEFEKF